MGKRKFTLSGSNIDTEFELDLRLALLALAHSRGRSGQRSAENIFFGKDQVLAKDRELDSHPVSLASTARGVFLPEETMSEQVLNPQLQAMCKKVGILLRNTMYNWRRTAFIDVRISAGLEIAKKILMHTPQSTTYQS